MKIKFIKNQNGFTLIELLASLMIITILTSIGIPAMAGLIEDAKGKAYIGEARTVCYSVQNYLIEQYSNGTLDSFQVLLDITLEPLGNENNVLTPILEGSYTPGAHITRIYIDGMAFKGITYVVDSYEIEIDLGKGVTVRHEAEN